MPELRLEQGRRAEDGVEIDTSCETEAMQQIEQILSRKVARRARGVRAAAEAAGRGVERRDSEIERRKHVGEGGATCVVKMQRNALPRNRARKGSQNLADLSRMCDADGVTDGHFVYAEIEQPRREIDDARDGHRALERTAECRRKIPADAQAVICGRARDCRIGRERVVNALIDIAPAERLGGGREDSDVRDASGTRAIETLQIRNKRRI